MLQIDNPRVLNESTRLEIETSEKYSSVILGSKEELAVLVLGLFDGYALSNEEQSLLRQNEVHNHILNQGKSALVEFAKSTLNGNCEDGLWDSVHKHNHYLNVFEVCSMYSFSVMYMDELIANVFEKPRALDKASAKINFSLVEGMKESCRDHFNINLRNLLQNTDISLDEVIRQLNEWFPGINHKDAYDTNDAYITLSIEGVQYSAGDHGPAVRHYDKGILGNNLVGVAGGRTNLTPMDYPYLSQFKGEPKNLSLVMDVSMPLEGKCCPSAYYPKDQKTIIGIRDKIVSQIRDR